MGLAAWLRCHLYGMEASTIGITQTLGYWVRNGLIEAADALVDVSEEVVDSIMWDGAEESS